jgi:hypothetical protein
LNYRGTVVIFLIPFHSEDEPWKPLHLVDIVPSHRASAYFRTSDFTKEAFHNWCTFLAQSVPGQLLQMEPNHIQENKVELLAQEHI